VSSSRSGNEANARPAAKWPVILEHALSISANSRNIKRLTRIFPGLRCEAAQTGVDAGRIWLISAGATEGPAAVEIL